MIYVDGCSYTAGHGLESKYSLANIIASYGYDVVDRSTVGKSNYSIALDIYNNLNHDCYIVGWTYASRMEFNFDNNVVYGAPSRPNITLNSHAAGEFLEKEYNVLNNKFFKYNSRFDKFTDFLIDSTAALLADKKIVYYSWEHRNCKTQILLPKFGEIYRQQDMPNWQQNGHLNHQGMQALAKLILDNI